MIGHERQSSRTTVNRLQDRRLHLYEATPIEELSDQTDNLCSQNEYFTHVGVHREVHITLAIAHLGIRQATVLFTLGIFLAERQRSKRLREKLKLLHLDGYLLCPRPKQTATHSDEVAQVEQLQ